MDRGGGRKEWADVLLEPKDRCGASEPLALSQCSCTDLQGLCVDLDCAAQSPFNLLNLLPNTAHYLIHTPCFATLPHVWHCHNIYCHCHNR